jgi:hypothetical protein
MDIHTKFVDLQETRQTELEEHQTMLIDLQQMKHELKEYKRRENSKQIRDVELEVKVRILSSH